MIFHVLLVTESCFSLGNAMIPRELRQILGVETSSETRSGRLRKYFIIL